MKNKLNWVKEDVKFPSVTIYSLAEKDGADVTDDFGGLKVFYTENDAKRYVETYGTPDMCILEWLWTGELKVVA